MSTAITLGTLNLNDGTNYFVDLEGLDLGQPITTWDEVPSYAGTSNVQVNVTAKKALIPVTIPMRVKGSSYADLNTKLSAIWTEVDKASNSLTFMDDSPAYSIVYSSRPANLARTYVGQFLAEFTLVLMRTP